MVKRKTHFSIDKRVGHHFILVHRLPLRITAQPRSNDQFREAVIHAEECIELETCEQHNDAEEKENRSLGSSHSQTKKIIPRVVLSTLQESFSITLFPLLFKGFFNVYVINDALLGLSQGHPREDHGLHFFTGYEQRRAPDAGRRGYGQQGE